MSDAVVGGAGRTRKALDWTTGFGEIEWEALQKRYADHIDSVGLGRYPFVGFTHDLRPDALKRYRLFLDTTIEGVGLATPIPGHKYPFMYLIVLHHYCTLGYRVGALGDIVASRTAGARKSDVADVLALAWLHSGPRGVNALAEIAGPYMQSWDASADGPAVALPSGWSVDPNVFRCGMDFGPTEANEISAKDLTLIKDWHQKWEGEVPAYVSFLGQNYPLALRVFRARFENVMTAGLPKELIALCRLYLAISWMRPDATRRALHMSRAFSVTKDQAAQVIASAMLYLGDLGIDAGLAGIGDALETW